MKKTITLIAVLLVALTVNAQNDVKFTINHLLGNNTFAFNTAMENDMGDGLKLTRFEYYISGISIIHDGGKITPAPTVYILAKANKTDTILLGNFDITNVEAIKFAVGVDPGVNNGDPAAWAASHALSPKSPSMQWGWAAGYRFAAIEGKSGINFNQDFQIHALGNKNYFKQTITTGATNVNGALVIALNADYAKSVSTMKMAQGLIEHSEDNAAGICLRNFQTKVFTSLTGQSSVARVEDYKVTNAVTIAPVPSQGLVSFNVENPAFQNANYTVVDIQGKEIANGNITSQSSLSIATKGLYFVTFEAKGVTSTEKLIIQ
jgi:hypothetical protein